MDGMGTWGEKLLALHQLNQACTLYTLELYPELLLPLVAFTLLAHSISSFAAFWMAIIFGVHTTVCVPLLLDPLISPDFANGYMMFFFPALKHSHERLVANAAQRPCVDHRRIAFGMNLQSFSSMNIEELLLLLC
jgi:hypothetical protein